MQIFANLLETYLLHEMRTFALNSHQSEQLIFCFVGMGGATGNKGSVAMSLTIYSTTFCFVCSHFAAGQNEVRDRNEDYMNTLKKIKFAQVVNFLFFNPLRITTN